MLVTHHDYSCKGRLLLFSVLLKRVPYTCRTNHPQLLIKNKHKQYLPQDLYLQILRNISILTNNIVFCLCLIILNNATRSRWFNSVQESPLNKVASNTRSFTCFMIHEFIILRVRVCISTDLHKQKTFNLKPNSMFSRRFWPACSSWHVFDYEFIVTKG